MPEPMATVHDSPVPDRLIAGPLIAVRVLGWYDAHARALPWRVPPGSPDRPDPYCVWLSEVMSQQTTLAAMTPYWRRFVERWPTVEALAAADEGDVLREWAGLGYYARARNLHACARAVAERGGFPRTAAALRALPGIGDYTAGAIAAIVWGQPVAAVDGNAERVAARVTADATPLPAARRALRRVVEGWVPADRPGDFAQGLMDLGATICTPRAPRCLLCPLAGGCAARAGGEPERYPVKPPRTVRPHRTGTAWWVKRDGRVALVRRAGERMLGGTLALPSSGWDGRASDWPDDLAAAPTGRTLGTVTHGFSHFTLTLDVVAAEVDGTPVDWLWWPVGELADAGLASLFAHAVASATAEGG